MFNTRTYEMNNKTSEINLKIMIVLVVILFINVKKIEFMVIHFK